MRLDFDSFYIEPIQIQDGWNLCDFIVANEDRLKSYFPETLAQNLTPDLSKFFVEKKVKEFQLKKEFLFILKKTKSKELIGLVYLKKVDWDKKQGEFAYCVGYQYEGKGFISKSIRALSIYAFKVVGRKTLQIIVHKTNNGSIKVAENSNFIWLRTLENDFTPKGRDSLDMELYELKNKN